MRYFKNILVHHRTQRGEKLWGVGSKPLPRLNHRNFYEFCVCSKILSKLSSYTHEILNSVQANVKNCTLISHFASAFGGFCPPCLPPGLCPWTPLGELLSLDSPARLPFSKFLIPVNPVRRTWVRLCSCWHVINSSLIPATLPRDRELCDCHDVFEPVTVVIVAQLYDLHVGVVGEHRRTDDGCYAEDAACGLRGDYERQGGHCGFNGACVASLVSTNFQCICHPGWRGSLCNTRKCS